MPRLFIALTPPAEIRAQLAVLRGPLAGFRWVPAENYHLTLQFLGQTPEEDLVRIAEALDRVAMAAFRVQVRGLGSFGPRDNPRVLWAGVEPSPELLAIRKDIRRCLRRLLDLEHERYSPHITLARAQSASTAGLHAYLQARQQGVDCEFVARQFHLLSSRLSPEGSRYAIEFSYPG